MFCKEKFKGIVIGAVGATLLTTTVFAAPVAKNAQLFFNNIKIFVDDVSVTPKDAQGNVVEPFIYNGTTYLPVRAVSNALGKSVEWDGKTSSVYIGKHNNSNSSTQPSSMWLEQLDYFNYQETRASNDWGLWDSSKDKDSTGASYSHGIKYNLYSIWDASSLFTEYLLNQKYKKLSGKFILHYDSRNVNRETYLKVYGDDKLLYTSEVMTAGKMPIDVNVDVTGVIKLKVMIDQPDKSGSGDMYFGFVDALLSE